MKFSSPFSQFLIGSLLIVGLSLPQMRGLADESSPALVLIVAPTPTVTPAPKSDGSPSESEATATKPEEVVNLLEIFPVQEPWKKSGDNANAPDEATIAAKALAGEVWVNSKSGVFHEAGTAHFGKTKKGFFLPEADALEKGYRSVKE